MGQYLLQWIDFFLAIFSAKCDYSLNQFNLFMRLDLTCPFGLGTWDLTWDLGLDLRLGLWDLGLDLRLRHRDLGLEVETWCQGLINSSAYKWTLPRMTDIDTILQKGEKISIMKADAVVSSLSYFQIISRQIEDSWSYFSGDTIFERWPNQDSQDTIKRGFETCISWTGRGDSA